jgi:hypothetical protein
MNVIQLSDVVNEVKDIDLYGPNSGIKLFYSSIIDASLQSRLEKKIYSIGDVQGHQTNIKAAMTHWDSHLDPFFLDLVKLVTGVIQTISDQFYNRPDINWYVKSCWGAFYKLGEHTLLHDHYPATWSAVYYVRQPRNGSCLNFPGPQVSLKPITGSLIVFPGNIEHEVPESISKENRVVVSMNFYVKETT